MKNAILGMISGFVIILSAVVCLSLYTSASLQNAMENNLSNLVETTLQKYYIPEQFRTEDQSYPTTQEVREELEKELKLRVSSDADISVTVQACDFEKGILSVRVAETYRSPTGNQKCLCFERTALVNATEGR